MAEVDYDKFSLKVENRTVIQYLSFQEKSDIYGDSAPSGLAKMILQDTVQGNGRKGRQKKRWEDNVRSGKRWTLLDQLWQLKTGLGGKGLL